VAFAVVFDCLAWCARRVAPVHAAVDGHGVPHGLDGILHAAPPLLDRAVRYSRQFVSDGLVRCTSQGYPSNALGVDAWLPVPDGRSSFHDNHFRSSKDLYRTASLMRQRAKDPEAKGLLFPLGCWVVVKLSNCDHFGVVPFPTDKEMPRAFFDLLFTLLDVAWDSEPADPSAVSPEDLRRRAMMCWADKS